MVCFNPVIKIICIYNYSKGNGTFQPRTGHESPEGE